MKGGIRTTEWSKFVGAPSRNKFWVPLVEVVASAKLTKYNGIHLRRHYFKTNICNCPCVILSLIASSPPEVDADAAAVTMVWKYIGELAFNMLVLVGTVKMLDRIIHEMMGL